MTSQSLCSSLDKFRDGPPKEYEEAIQKLEGDVRMHIRVEQQMRLHIENLQQKIEDIGREHHHNIKMIKVDLDDLKTEKRRLTELLNIKDQQLNNYKREKSMNSLFINEKGLKSHHAISQSIIPKPYSNDLSYHND